MNAESGANAHAVNQNTGGSYDVGLWQINDFNWVRSSIRNNADITRAQLVRQLSA